MKKILKDNKDIIISFLLSRLILITFLIVKKDLSVFDLYDCIHYQNIAQNGYTMPYQYAFFPLYPITIKLLHYIIPSYKISGALISNIFSFLTLILLKKITKNKYSYLCYLFSPILAYNTIAYTESIFMFLTLLGYYLYKQNKYFSSSLVVGLSIICRNSGIILWGAIGLDMLYRYFKTKDIKFKDILLFGIIALLIGGLYPLYLYKVTGNPFEFITIQGEKWGRKTATIIYGFISDIKQIIKTHSSLYPFILNWSSFVLVFILGINLFKKDKTSSIYIIVSLIAMTITYRDINKWNTLASISLFRYVLNLFPIYLYLPKIKTTNHKIIFLTMCYISIISSILIYEGDFLG